MFTAAGLALIGAGHGAVVALGAALLLVGVIGVGRLVFAWFGPPPGESPIDRKPRDPERGPEPADSPRR